MLDVLYDVEKRLEDLLLWEDGWNSIFVNYHLPFVERLWRQDGENRIYLHRILPCERKNSLFHPHPWPSAMRICQGRYKMSLGYGKGDTPPPIAATLIMQPHSVYEMTSEDAWHNVVPIGMPTMSLMVTGKPWNRTAPKSHTQLLPLSQEKRDEIRAFFYSYYGNIYP